MLDRHQIPHVASDANPRLVAPAQARANRFAIGAMPHARSFLRACGLENACAIVITMNSPRAIEIIVALARRERPDITIVARARDAHHATVLYGLGATDANPETIEASLQLSEAVLVDIGIPMGYVIASIHEKRDEYRRMLQPTGQVRDERGIRLSTRVRDMKKPPRSERPAPQE